MYHGSSSAACSGGNMYHGSSLAACSGGNITFSSEGTPWSTPVVSTRDGAAGDEVVMSGEFLADVHPAFECGETFVEPVHFHTMFNPLKRVVFLLDFSGDGVAGDFEFGVALVVMAVSLHLCEGGGVVEVTGHLSQGVVGSSPSLEEFNELVW